MKLRQRIQKSDSAEATVADQKQRTRLTEITVNEVSVVDRAANKRQFLVVKHAQPATKADNNPTPPAPPPGPGQQPQQTPTPPQLKISPELKATVLGALTTAQEHIAVIQQVLQGSTETPGAPPPQELMEALQQLAQLFAAPAGAANNQQQPPPAQQPPANPPVAKQSTEKAGRKLSTARLKTLSDMRTQLDSLITEVSGTDPDDKGDGEDETKEPAKKQEQSTPPSGEPPANTPPVVDPNAPTQPDTNNDDEETQPKKKPDPEQPAPELQKFEQRIQTQLAGFSETLAKMVSVFENQNARIASIAKSRGQSQQSEDLDDVKKQKSERVVWAHDMAAQPKSYQ